MVEMANCLPYKHDNHATAINLIDAQSEKINSQVTFAREQDRLEMIRVLHAAHVESGNGKILDLEFLLNQIGGAFKPDEEAPEDDRDESRGVFLSRYVNWNGRLRRFPSYI